MGYPYPYFRLCAFLGSYPKEKIMAECQDEREAAVAGLAAVLGVKSSLDITSAGRTNQ